MPAIFRHSPNIDRFSVHADVETRTITALPNFALSKVKYFHCDILFDMVWSLGSCLTMFSQLPALEHLKVTESQAVVVVNREDT